MFLGGALIMPFLWPKLLNQIDFISTLSKLTPFFPGLKRLTLLHPDKLSARLLTSSPSEAVQVKTVGIRPAARNGDRLSRTRLSWGEGGGMDGIQKSLLLEP